MTPPGLDPQRGLVAAQATRRRFLTATGAAAALALTGELAGVRPAEALAPGSLGSAELFTLGVASGDPLPDAVVIWTRLAPEPTSPTGGMPARPVPVQWEVAEDERFRRVVRRGSARAVPESAHTVHVDVQGLRPRRHYWYRFRVGSQLSPVGRTRTAPAPGEAVAELSLAVASCQAIWEGWFTAYADMARRDHDAVLFLGDYIYEFGIDRGVRPDSAAVENTRQTVTLDEYRHRYAQYKLDPDLQAAHAAAPWIVTLDDHEVVDNWADEAHPSAPAAQFLVRRANGFRAYWEHMPLRLAQAPQGPDMQLYRRLRFGSLAEVNVLDTRQYRSDQAMGDGSKPPNPESQDPRRTLTGDRQEQWLLDGMAGSGTTWNVIGQQNALARLDTVAGPDVAVPMDTWDGYEGSRRRVLGGIAERGVDNVVSLGGDLHRSVASDLRLDFSDPSSPVMASEFVGTSIASGLDGQDLDPGGAVLLAENPHIRYCNFQRGYTSCTITPRTWKADYRVVDRVTVPDGEVSTRTTLVVEAGRPGIQES
ncbi:twin-arginine translocation signal domain-containing protein [Auraticoccus sp. F435]|uniref:Twin-arginine translocation signal domain-containing protein n=1 Tax=Auraticoccus cholistanensis TaxID=2656650 RepID=A0A6A9USD9_9ACTN|nr:alkaline phosphatase D family protein [Auraticoccus cholistanensis]MVA74602.1 twin-arginine translocation signal domain-containing protein [Auraticoccus cholistanensis]